MKNKSTNKIQNTEFNKQFLKMKLLHQIQMNINACLQNFQKKEVITEICSAKHFQWKEHNVKIFSQNLMYVKSFKI